MRLVLMRFRCCATHPEIYKVGWIDVNMPFIRFSIFQYKIEYKKETLYPIQRQKRKFKQLTFLVYKCKPYVQVSTKNLNL